MDMNITYEDGLRLSELNGRLAQIDAILSKYGS